MNFSLIIAFLFCSTNAGFIPGFRPMVSSFFSLMKNLKNQPQGRQYSKVKRNTMAENAEIYDLAAQAMEKLYGGSDGNFATFEKRGRGLMTNMFGDMVSPDW